MRRHFAGYLAPLFFRIARRKASVLRARGRPNRLAPALHLLRSRGRRPPRGSRPRPRVGALVSARAVTGESPDRRLASTMMLNTFVPHLCPDLEKAFTASLRPETRQATSGQLRPVGCSSTSGMLRLPGATTRGSILLHSSSKWGGRPRRHQACHSAGRENRQNGAARDEYYHDRPGYR